VTHVDAPVTRLDPGPLRYSHDPARALNQQGAPRFDTCLKQGSATEWANPHRKRGNGLLDPADVQAHDGLHISFVRSGSACEPMKFFFGIPRIAAS
jgi:hypothetical protein